MASTPSDSTTPADADTPPEPTYTPRSGDPFASPTPPQPARKRAGAPRKKGRRFFLWLLVIGGTLAFGGILLFANSKTIMVGMYRDLIIPRSVPEALPPDMPVDDARQFIHSLLGFFGEEDTNAPSLDVPPLASPSNDALLEMMAHIKSALADEILTPDEVAQLAELATTLRTRPETGTGTP